MASTTPRLSPIAATLAVLLLLGCPGSEPIISSPNTAPSIVLLAPVLDAGVEEYVLQREQSLQVTARTSDTTDPAEDLSVRFFAERRDQPGDPVELATVAPDDDGYVEQLIPALDPGPWLLTAQVVDPDGDSSRATLPLLVLDTNEPPECTISAPNDGSAVIEGSQVTFSGTALDDRDTSVLAIQWRSDLDGLLNDDSPSATGLLTFSTTALSAGAHRISLRAEDTLGAWTDAGIDLVVVPPDEPPSAPTVHLSPADPSTADALLCEVVTPSVDPNGQAITYQFTWLRDTVATPWTDPSLPANQTARDEVWTCRVRGFDGTLLSDPGEATLTIANSPPSLSSVSLTPIDADETDTLTCSATGWSDADGDPQQIQYAWEIDGAPVVGATGATLTGADFDRDDFVACIATPFDGTDAGASLPGSPVIIANAVPAPPTVAVTPSPVADVGSSLTCLVSGGADPDPADSVSYELEWWVDGLHNSTFDGFTTIVPAQTHLGEAWTCQARSSDGIDVSAWVAQSTDVLPSVGDVVITELLATPAAVSDAAGEWVELYNATPWALDLAGFTLRDDGANTHVISSSVVVPAGGRVVLGRNSDPSSNGGVSLDYEYSGFGLDFADEVVLAFDGAEIDRFDYDLAAWPGGVSGHAIGLDPALGVPDAGLNDSVSNWCPSMTPFASAGDRGTPGTANDSCDCYPSDGDGDGYGVDAICPAADCDDSDPAISPEAVDTCENGIDEDCDGGDALCDCLSTDSDGDGYGVGAACSLPDCDDSDDDVYPGAPEFCDGIDEDCDGDIDEGFDGDGDGETTCAGDCDDGDPAINTGTSELCNGVDDDCVGGVDDGFDVDGDGWTTCEGDCDDGASAVHPSQADTCDGIDSDCDGPVDEDATGDGYEPNGSALSAAFFLGDDTADTIFSSIHNAADAADWFWLDVEDDPNSGCDQFRIEATLSSLPAGANYNLYLYDASSQMLDFSEGAGASPESVLFAPGCDDPTDSIDHSGVYYLEVRRHSGASCSDTYALAASNSG